MKEMNPASKLRLLSKYLILVILFCDNRFLRYGEVYLSIFPSIESSYLQMIDTFPSIEKWNLLQWLWRLLFVFLGLNVFRNNLFRPSMLMIGLLLIFSLSANNLLYNNNAFYAATLFVIIGLAPPKLSWKFIFIQVSILYLMTVLSKGDGWYTGDFFAVIIERQFFFRDFLPEQFVENYIQSWMLISISILTLIIEVLIGVLILFKSTRKYSAILALAFHLMLSVLLGKTFNVFMAIILGVNWIVLYDLSLQKVSINTVRKSALNGLINPLLMLLSRFHKHKFKWIEEPKAKFLKVEVKPQIIYENLRGFFAILRNTPQMVLLTPFVYLIFDAPYIFKVKPFVIVLIYSSILLFSIRISAFKKLKTI